MNNNVVLHHVSLVVADLQVALDFYCNVMGLEIDDSRPEMAFVGAWLKVGTQQMHLLELPNSDPVDGRPEHGGRDRHVAFSVNNLDDYKAILEKRDIDYTLSISGRRALFCRDPDGNACELIER